MSWKTVTRVRLALAAVLFANLAGAPARGETCAGPRVAFPYPIVIKGPKVAGAYRVKSFVAWVWRGGAWAKIPLQVEEVNAKGDYVLSGGLPFTKGSDDGWIDANDELVVDGLELGDDFTDANVPDAMAKTAYGSWKVGFCKGASRLGFVLVQSLKVDPPAWSGKGAVVFDEKKGEINTELYRYKFQDSNPVLLGEVALKHDGHEASVIQSSKFLMPLKTPFFLPDLTFQDKDFTSSIESWQAGPLRTIVAVGVKYTAFLSVFKLHLFSELVFYRNRFVIPTVIEFVFDPSKYLSPGSGLAYALKFPPGRGWKVESNLAPLPAKDAALVVEKGPKADSTEVFRARGSSPDGAFLVQVRVDEKARREVPPPFLIQAADFVSKQQQEHWPWLEDIAGDLGVFLDFSRIKQGIYNFGLDLLLATKADEFFTDYGLVATEWQHLPTRP